MVVVVERSGGRGGRGGEVGGRGGGDAASPFEYRETTEPFDPTLAVNMMKYGLAGSLTHTPPQPPLHALNFGANREGATAAAAGRKANRTRRRPC